METLFKRHFWVINLIGLAVIAWLVGGAITGFIGMKLSAASGGTTNVSSLRAEGGVSGLALKLKNARAGDGSGGAMSAASAFLIDEPPEPEPEPEDEEESSDEEAEEEGPVEATYEVTQLPLKLLGTMVVRPEAYSSATMEVNRRDKKIVIVGYELLGGQARVEEIHRTYVVLKESGKLTIAPLWPRPSADKSKSAAKNRTTPSSARKPRVSAGGRSRGGSSGKGVRKLSSTSYQIERGMLNRKLKNLAALGQQARVVPNYHRGRYSGFRMIGMGSSSLFRDIGFQNGDIVKVINGNRIDSPNKALALYEGLKNKARLTVQIERGGMLKTLRYIVR